MVPVKTLSAGNIIFLKIRGCIFCKTIVYWLQKTTEYFVFRAGCDSPLAVKSATGCRMVSADPVKLRDQQYSLDGRR